MQATDGAVQALCFQTFKRKHTVRQFTAVLALTLGICLNLALSAPALAAPFDGNWRVLIVTEKGDCDRAFSYELGVADGKVHYRGAGSVQVSGTVSPRGAVRVNISYGEHGATGTGRIDANSGTGSWRGVGPNAECSGRWEAERR